MFVIFFPAECQAHIGVICKTQTEEAQKLQGKGYPPFSTAKPLSKNALKWKRGDTPCNVKSSFCVCYLTSTFSESIVQGCASFTILLLF